MALSCQPHSYVGFIADSCHFQLSHTSLTWVQSVKIYWRKLSKKSVLVVDLFFLPNFRFIFGNMSDSCRFHGPFMALSWRFLPSDFYCFPKQFHGTCMADSWQIHGSFMALSWHFPVTFLALSPLGMFGFAMKVP